MSGIEIQPQLEVLSRVIVDRYRIGWWE